MGEHVHDKSCGHSKEFDYCFWAKLLVAVPLLPFVATVAASYFESSVLQVFAAAAAVVAVVWVSRWIDRIPALSKPIHLRKS